MQAYDGYFLPGITVINATADCINGCLFNITADPYESNDLSAAYPGVLAMMKAKLQTYVNSPSFEPEQNADVDPLSLPALHDGIWMPFMDEVRR
jgi:hypothetical protein